MLAPAHDAPLFNSMLCVWRYVKCRYHRRQRRVKASLCPAVLSIAVLITAAVIDEAHLQVYTILKPKAGPKQSDIPENG